MTITVDMVLRWLPMLITLAGIILVSRNARRANSTQMQNVDLARIRDLRVELTEAKGEVDRLIEKVHEANRIATEANRTATDLYLERQEMIRYASMPGVTIEMWLDRFGGDHQLGRR